MLPWGDSAGVPKGALDVHLLARAAASSVALLRMLNFFHILLLAFTRPFGCAWGRLDKLVTAPILVNHLGAHCARERLRRLPTAV